MCIRDRYMGEMGSNQSQGKLSLSLTASAQDLKPGELFDHSSNSRAINNFKIKSNSSVVRSNNSIQLQELKDSQNEDPVLNIVNAGGTYCVFPAAAKTSLWTVVRNFGVEDGERIAEGTVMKFGRSKYRVERVAIKDGDMAQYERSYSPRSFDQSRAETEQGEEVNDAEIALRTEEVKVIAENKMCRICLSAEQARNDPLVATLCKCSGTANAIHVTCLRRWMRSKIKICRRPCVTSYYWRPFRCEVCKAKYPDIVHLSGGKQLQALDVEYPRTNYMMLQSEASAKSGEVHVVSLGCKSTFRIVYFVYRK
eukprot:TRINITY_DN11289_c0_g2_i24.p1 TRINITY_DN11289_c0_g2~~TRINITY_DN11289_c0_g2_i24.p1  ORF type:complete len:310 (+),score=65.06 TRINITY_DN11289_c0_g2_i24:73-1002(+)